MFDILAAEVIKQRDPQNGLGEDIISDPRGCSFNANILACNMPSAAEKCITADQLSTLHKHYNDWTHVNQTFVYGHLGLGSEAS
jgi:feruloyl esterase